MPIDVTVRHVEAGNASKRHAALRAGGIAEEFPRVEHVHVILDVQKHRYIAEVVVQAKNHIRVEAMDSADNFNAAIEGAVEKARKQLRKLRDKVQEKRPKGKGGAESPGADEEEAI